MVLEPIELPEEYENTREECDAALGLYMRALNSLELSTFQLFEKLVDTDIVTASILFNAGSDQRAMRSILDALGKQRLRKADSQKVKSLLRRMNNATQIRNRLVHGRWQLKLELKKGTHRAETAEWFRFYPPTDHETYDKIFGKNRDQKLIASHYFSLEKIVQCAKGVNVLARNVSDFVDRVSLVPVRVPQPVF